MGRDVGCQRRRRPVPRWDRFPQHRASRTRRFARSCGSAPAAIASAFDSRTSTGRNRSPSVLRGSRSPTSAATVVAGSERVLHVRRKAQRTLVPARAPMLSDAVDLPVKALSSLLDQSFTCPRKPAPARATRRACRRPYVSGDTWDFTAQAFEPKETIQCAPSSRAWRCACTGEGSRDCGPRRFDFRRGRLDGGCQSALARPARITARRSRSAQDRVGRRESWDQRQSAAHRRLRRERTGALRSRRAGAAGRRLS